MKSFDWSPDKNAQLLRERAVSFERIILAIEDGHLLDVLEHPNREKYPDQRLLVVEIAGYAFLVPFVEEGERWFLKTIIPSRKATRLYLEVER